MSIKKGINIQILIISDSDDDVRSIEAHLASYMRLPWSFMHCVSVKEAVSRINRSDVVVLDLGLKGFETPKEIFSNIGDLAFDKPIIVLTGEGADEHNLATYVMEQGAADNIIRGKFGRLVDAIEFALIRQKIIDDTKIRTDKTLEVSQGCGADDLRDSKAETDREKENSKQLMAWLTGGYSATESNK